MISKGIELSVLSDAIRRLSDTRTEKTIVSGNWEVTDGSWEAFSVAREG